MRFILFFLLLSVPVEAAHREFIIMGCREDSGLFSVFSDVLALVKCYDQGRYEGIEVDFGKSGLYYDTKFGPNWWNYYCEPICLGEKKRIRYTVGYIPYARPSEIEQHTSRGEACRLINKYITFKPSIVEKVDAFQKKHFVNKFVLGIHYRGTDKKEETPRVPYEQVGEAVQHVLQEIGQGNVCIFVATDEAEFVEYMLRTFGSMVVCNTDVVRSRDDQPLHLSSTRDRYQCGKGAIEDCLLLARCTYFIRTSSNMGLWATFLNPKMPVLELKLAPCTTFPSGKVHMAEKSAHRKATN